MVLVSILLLWTKMMKSSRLPESFLEVRSVFQLNIPIEAILESEQLSKMEMLLK